MTGLLASVATLEEAGQAVAWGADIVDLKDPARGALGAWEPAALRVAVARLGAHKQRPLPTGLKPEHLQKPFILITGHRRESYGEGFQHICNAIKTLAGKYPSHNFIYPVHLNKHVQGPVKSLLGNINNVILTGPLDYPDFIHLMERSHLLLTDSGGLQEEDADGTR